MAELSRRSGVPVTTVKYYLREGLLPPGTPTAATRAEYDEAHLRRLRLIRALLEIGEVPVATIGKILAVVDDESVGVHFLLGAVQYTLGPHPAPRSDEGDVHWQAASREVDDLIGELGWIVGEGAPARSLLAATLAALRQNGPAVPSAGLRTYAEAMSRLADQEVAFLDAQGDRGTDRAALTEAAVVGMVLGERILIALRRLAQEDASARHFGSRAD